MLSITRHGDETANPTLLIAHGLFGSARNWGVLSKRLSDRGAVLAVDMRNHGDSPRDPDHSYPALAGDLAEVIAAEGGPMDVLGHSMGGKAAMALALTRPDLVRKLVVADIAPVAYAHTQSDLIEAMRAVDLSKVETRKDADAQLSGRVSDPGVRAFLLQSLDARQRRWLLNLDTLQDQMDAIIGWPEDLAGSFDGPTLFLSGAESDYVRPENRVAIAARFPRAVFARIPGAGHWLHAEKPRETEAAVRTFLDA